MESSHESGQASPLPINSDGLGAMPPLSHPQETEAGSVGSRIGNTLRAVKADFSESEHRTSLVASGLGTVAVQAADRLRASIVLVPQVAINVLQNTNSPVEAGVAAGLTFAGWCAIVGGTTTEALNKYPKTMEAFGDNFPGVVDFFDEALPGVDDYDKDKADKHSLARRIGGRVLTGAKRGLTVSGIGTVAYVSTAATKGNRRSAIHRLNANASAEGGVVIGGVVYGIAETISQISVTHPALAERIVNDASNIKLWYGVAGVMIAGQYISTKIQKFRNRENQEQTQP